MKLHKNFVGGNIRIIKTDGDTVFLDNELRDTTEDWFYFAFCVEGAAGKTVTFRLPPIRLGYYGPAVSHDLRNWHWLGGCTADNADSFTYTFGEDENKVYFAHDILYHPDRFEDFCRAKNLEIKELCKSRKGRSVPYVTIGDGENIILLTARHHACESTGSYVLEGVLDGIMSGEYIENTKVVCVPFVDYDGVVDGDQGKRRAPFDHNRDYEAGVPALYPETRAIREIADKGILYGFDFHSPWHFGSENDKAFIVIKRPSKLEKYNRFGKILENITASNEKSFGYKAENNYPCDVGWNSSASVCFGCYMNDTAHADIAFTLETAYFGTPCNIFTAEGGKELGRCFAKATKKYYLSDK